MDKRTILAMILCGLLVVAWTYAAQQTAKRKQQEFEQQQRKEAVEQGPPPAGETGRPAGEEPAPKLPVVQPGAEEPAVKPAPTPVVALPPEPAETRQTITTGQYRLTFTNRGAALVDATFLHYYQTFRHNDELTVLEAPPSGAASLALHDPTPAGAPYGGRVYDLVEQAPDHLTYRALFANGIEITKTYRFAEDRFHIFLDVGLRNTGPASLPARYRLDGGVRIVPEFPGEPFLNADIGTLKGKDSAKVFRFAPKSVAETPGEVANSKESPLLWAGSSNKYFAAVLQPLPSGGRDSTDMLYRAGADNLPKVDKYSGRGGDEYADNVAPWLETVARDLAPGETLTDHYLFYIGPKQTEALAEKPYDHFDALIDYGWFALVSRLLLALLNFFHLVVRNYGFAIILLTLAVRAVLHPLQRKSQVSMYRMQRLQPFIKELREKYKNDRQKLGQEQMALFKKHGVNPMSGCLPIFLQFPIFLGLFRALQWSFDLRQAPFIFWVHDLSLADTVGHAVLPFLGLTAINILPVLMVISWVGQQKLMPKPVDPDQAKQQRMMMFMPIIFGFMLYSMASGLTLYWLTSTFFGILEQKYIKHQISKLEAAGKLGAIVETAPSTPPAKSKGRGSSRRGR